MLLGYFILIILLYGLMIDATMCPNFCSGHGACFTNGTCACSQLYDAAPDCSQSDFLFQFEI